MRFARHDITAGALATLMAATGVHGQEASWQEASWPEASYNRQPAAEDLVLPMPCGGAMVFRPVDVPGNGIFDDRKIVVGGRDPERAFIEHTRPAHVGGTFSVEGGRRYYLGKYEVTDGQYQALAGNCAATEGIDASLPKVEVTMGEVMLAAERYSGWLLNNAAEGLPRENGAPGYVRLPTESEWEYAARGGIAVGSADFEARLPPMQDQPESYVVFCRTDCALELAGLLKPNPLGLHDMHGNVSELVQGTFRLSRVGRENGSAGGYVKRGGSYLTRLEQTHSGLREEFAPLSDRGLRREPTTGFRLALVAPVLPDRARLEQARALWAGLAEAEKVTLGDERADPRAELRTLAEFAERLGMDEAPELRRRLLAVADMIDVTIASRNEERARAAREMLRVAAFAGLRLSAHQASMRRCEELMELNPERYEARCQQIREDSAFDHDFYLDHLVRMTEEFPEAVISQQFTILEQEFGSRLEKALACLPVVASNLDTVRTRGAEGRDEISASWEQACGA